MKELHIITGKGKMGQCDLYPKGSLHIVEVKDGRRTTKNGRDSIHRDIESRNISEREKDFQLFILTFSVKCEECDNDYFVKDAEFHDGTTCIRCYERKNNVNRD